MENQIKQTISLINQFIKVYKNFELDNLENILSDNIEFKNILQGEIIEHGSNLNEFTLILEQSKMLFSSKEIQIENLNINQNIVNVDAIIKVVMASSTPNGIKVGQKLNYKSSFSFTINNNKISKIIQIS